MPHALATIGYQSLTLPQLIQILKEHRIDTLVDVRAVANSRRPGFGKTKLSAGLEEAGIHYLHLRGLGTPASGRAAARRGDHAAMRAVFMRHFRTAEAQDDLAELTRLTQGRQRLCLLCLEADPTHCHRRFIADAIHETTGIRIEHLET